MTGKQFDVLLTNRLVKTKPARSDSDGGPGMTAPLTAGQEIVLAALDLTDAGKAEFTEWDLTVAAWTRDRKRFGMKGYDHPDHKRVYMEITGKKVYNPVTSGLLQRVRANVLRLTDLGRAEAARLTAGGGLTDRYAAASRAATHPAFLAWQNDPEAPRHWPHAARFLGDFGPHGSTAHLRAQVIDSIDWCQARNLAALPAPFQRVGEAKYQGRREPVPVRDLSDVLAFLTVLENRFPRQLGRKAVPA